MCVCVHVVAWLCSAVTVLWPSYIVSRALCVFLGVVVLCIHIRVAVVDVAVVVAVVARAAKVCVCVCVRVCQHSLV